jgi:hypothetical protein
MTQPVENLPKRRRRRRWPIVVAAVLIGAGLLWHAAERWIINVDRYRPLLIDKVQEATGLRVSVGRLSLSLLPTPNVEAQGVILGEGNFRASAEHVRVGAELGDLFRGELNVTEVGLHGLEVVLPQDRAVLVEKWRALVARRKESTPGTLKTRLTRVWSRDAKFSVDGSRAPLAFVGFDARDVLGPAPSVEFAATVPRFGAKARLQGRAEVQRPADGKGFGRVTGQAEMLGLEAKQLLRTESSLPLALDMELVIESAESNNLAARLTGRVRSLNEKAASEQGLCGPLTARVWWRDGSLIINDLDWKAPGAALVADLTRSPNGEIACHIRHAQAGRAGIEPLAQLIPDVPLRLSVQEQASIEATDLLLGIAPSEWPRLSKGSVAFARLDLIWQGQRTAAKNILGRASVEEGAFHVAELSAEGISLRGRVEPDFQTGRIAVDLRGKVDPTRAQLVAFLPSGAVTELGGAIEVEQLVGTFTPAKLIPQDLKLRINMVDGRFSVKTARFSDTFRDVAARITTIPEGVSTHLAGESAKLRTFLAEGRYGLNDRQWAGRVSLDVERAGMALASETMRDRILPMLHAYGASSFAVSLRLSEGARPEVVVDAVREGEPSLGARVSVGREAGVWRLGAVEASAEVPAEALLATVPFWVEGSGVALATLKRLPEEDRFLAKVNLSPCSISMGGYLNKPEGRPMTIEVLGETSPRWTPRALVFTCLGESVQGQLVGDRWIFEDAAIVVSRLAGLLPGGIARGRITGSIVGPPLAANLALDNVGFALSPDLAIDSVSGTLTHVQGQWTCPYLAFRGANSEGTVSGNLQDGRWRGKMAGRQLDVNRLTALRNAFHAIYATRIDFAPEPATRHRPLTGDITADFDSVLYRRGRFSNAHADIGFDERTVRIENLALASYSGGVTGTITVDRSRSGEPGWVKTNLELHAADARIIDDLLFTQPRALTGDVSGTLQIKVPTGSTSPALHGAGGRMEFVGRNGSLGKLGLATKLLTVLRTVEIVRLRLPTLKDEGLIYDTCSGRLLMNNGVLHVEAFDLQGATLTMTAAGTINFPQNNMDLRIRVHLLGGLSGVVEQVPVVGGAVSEIRKRGGVVLAATGPPDDPQVRIETIEGLQTEVLDATRAGEQLLKDAAKGLLDNVLGR